MITVEEFAQKYNVKVYTELPTGWLEDNRANTAPAGTVWIHNNKSRFSGERERGLLIKEGK